MIQHATEPIICPLFCIPSLVAQTVKNLLAVPETWVQSLGREDPLEKGVAIHSGDFCLENPTDRGAKQATIHGVAKSRARLSDFTFTSHFSLNV